MIASPIEVVVAARRQEAADIVSFVLARPDDVPLPPFTAGSHIDVQTPAGHIRQYSLLNDPDTHYRYHIAVLRDPGSQGGSISLHEKVKAGDRLSISAPRNLFPLNETAPATLLFAGGIGITPILAMARRLSAIGADFDLHYSARSSDRAAFLDQLAASPFAARLHCHFDDGETAQNLDIEAVLKSADPEAHLYVCGPSGFMSHVLDAGRRLGWTEERLHREYFSAPIIETTANGSFTVKIASTGAELIVPADRSALAVLLEHGYDVPMSCEQGVCGTCLLRVCDGVPDHRDLFLTDEEKRANDQFTPCCSRSHTPLLVLDL